MLYHIPINCFRHMHIEVWVPTLGDSCCIFHLFSPTRMDVSLGSDFTNFYEGMKEVFYLMTHSTHFIYSYLASGIW